MTRIPAAPLILGLAGLIPFLWGALTLLSDPLYSWGYNALGGRFVSPFIQLYYGAIILSFMSGVLWGFATKANSAIAPICYLLSVIPALWVFFMTGSEPASAQLNLIIGFTGLLAIDFAFSRWGLTPDWWMSLRVLLTGVVIITLALGVL